MTTNNDDGQYDTLGMPPPPKDFALNKLLADIADEMTDGDLEKIKFLFMGDDGFRKKVLAEMKTPLDLFTYMKQYTFISRENVIYLQCILHYLNKQELSMRAIQYAKLRGDTVYFFSPSSEPANGFTHVKVHVTGKDFEKVNKSDIQNIKTTMSEFLGVPPHLVVIRGIEPGSSLLVTLMIPTQYADFLRDLGRKDGMLEPLSAVGIDTILVGEDEFHVNESSSTDTIENDQQMRLKTTYEQLEKKKHQLDERDAEVLKLTRKLRDKQPVQFVRLFDFNLGLFIQFLFGEYTRQYRQICPKAALETPSPLQRLCQLARYRDCIAKVKSMDYDLDVISDLLSASKDIVEGRVQEVQQLHIDRLSWLVKSLQCEVFNLQVQRETAAIENNMSFIENMLIRMIQFIAQQNQRNGAQDDSYAPISPALMPLVKKASRGLRNKDREVLKGKYRWNERDDLTTEMQNHDLFLPVLYIKEVEDQIEAIPIDTFVSNCLEQVGRRDLKKRFHDDFKRITARKSLKGCKQERSRTPNDKEGQTTRKIDTILEKVTNVESIIETNMAKIPAEMSDQWSLSGMKGASTHGYRKHAPFFQ